MEQTNDRPNASDCCSLDLKASRKAPVGDESIRTTLLLIQCTTTRLKTGMSGHELQCRQNAFYFFTVPTQLIAAVLALF